MIQIIFENTENIVTGSFLGILGCTIGFMVYSEQPDAKTIVLRILTSLIISPICFIFSGIWFDDEMIRVLIALAAGFIGRPLLRAVHSVVMIISEKPIETIEKLITAWRKK